MVNSPDPGVVTASTPSAAAATRGNAADIKRAVARAARRRWPNSAMRGALTSESRDEAAFMLMAIWLMDRYRQSIATRHLADAVVVGVADIDRAIGADRRAVRSVEPGFARRPAIAAGALTAAGDRGDRAGARVEAANRMVLGVDDQDAAVSVDRHLFRRVEYRGKRRSVVA